MNNDTVSRAFPDNGAAIVFAADDKYAKYTAVTIQSVIDHSSDTHYYDVIILSSDISSETEEKLAQLVAGKDNFSLRVLHVGHYFDQVHLFTENLARISKETYFRVLIPELFSGYERVIYLDGDMVANTDIAQLYEVPFDGQDIISTRDLWGTVSCYMEERADFRAYREELLHGTSVDDYFIAGLMIFNIPQLARYNIDFMVEMAASREWKQHDQDLLNSLFAGKTKLLPANWDYMFDLYNEMRLLPEYLQQEYENAKENPFIIHFGGARKPWGRMYAEDDMAFWHTAQKTPFFEDIFFDMNEMVEYKCFLLRMLFGVEPTLKKERNNLTLSYHDGLLGKFAQRTVRFEFLSLNNGCLEAEGVIPDFGLTKNNHVEVFLKTGDKLFKSVSTSLFVQFLHNHTEVKWTGIPFKFRIPLKDLPSMAYFSVVCMVDGIQINMNRLRFGQFCAISASNIYSYQLRDGYVLQPLGWQICVKRVDEADREAYESRFLESFKDRDDYEQIKRLRKQAKTTKPEREIWLFSDRTNKADDNGEALFRYVNAHPELNIDSYFILREDSADFSRLQEIGKVVPYLSEKHLLLHLLCSYNLSAQADEPVICPFGDNSPYRDLLQTQRYVFLQHGVLESDISRWCNRQRNNAWVMVTSAERERESILTNPRYNFDETVVKVTGLSRHDRLTSRPKKTITIMPTWRKYLGVRDREDEGVWRLRSDFYETIYYRNINGLITDEKLRAAAQRLGYTLCFMPHPNIQSGLDKFTHCDDVVFYDITKPYHEVFSDSDLVVTDYSSSVLDFAYLRKPILYFQFDQEEFSSGEHTSKITWFQFERDGFGECEYSLDGIVDRIIEYMENDCAIKPKYLERIENFFVFSGQGSCARLMGEIKKKEQNEAESMAPLPYSSFVTIDASRNARKSVEHPVTKSKVFKKCRAEFHLDCEMPGGRLKALLSRPSYWATSVVNETPVQIPVPVVRKEEMGADMHAPAIAGFEDVDSRQAFLANLARVITGSVPYASSDWNAPLDIGFVGARWHDLPVKDGKLETPFVPGDIVSFKDGALAMVCETRGESRIRFICPVMDKIGCAVYVGALISGKKPLLYRRSSELSELPAINWVLRRY